MAANALSWPFTNQTDDSDFGEDLPAYAVANHDEKSDEHDTEKQRLLRIQQSMVARRDDTSCLNLDVKADNPNSAFIYDVFSTVSRLA